MEQTHLLNHMSGHHSAHFNHLLPQKKKKMQNESQSLQKHKIYRENNKMVLYGLKKGQKKWEPLFKTTHNIPI